MKHLYYAAEKIQADGLGEIGVDLYVGTMPADVKRCAMLRDPLMGAAIDEEMEGFTKHQFQIIVRDIDPAAAWDRAKALGDALKVENVTGNGVVIRKMHPLTLPATYPQMDSDEMETSINMRVWFALA